MSIEKPKQEAQMEVVRLKPEEIRTMPERFYVASKTGMKRRTKIIIVVGIFVVIVGAGAVFFSIDWSNKTTQLNINNNQQVVENDNINVNLNDNLNDGNSNIDVTVGNSNSNDNTNLNTNDNSNVNTNVNINNANANINVGGMATVFSSLDSDKDGLTDVEEDLYKTSKNKPDTDGDTYIDGTEVRAGYDPVDSKGRLENAVVVKAYINNLQGYKMLYPAIWVLRTVDNEGRQVILQSDVTKEFVEVLVNDSTDSFVGWYGKMTKGDTESQIVIINGWQAIYSPDGFTVYLTKDGLGKIYSLDYNYGSLTEISYKTTFMMMVNSFTAIEIKK